LRDLRGELRPARGGIEGKKAEGQEPRIKGLLTPALISQGEESEKNGARAQCAVQLQLALGALASRL
jgi:hypothetical protein